MKSTYARRLTYGAEMARAWEAYNAGDFANAFAFLKRQRPGTVTSSLSTNAPDFRDWEWRYLWQQLRPRELFKLAAPGRVRSVAFHPEGRLLAGVTHENVLRVWDLKTRHEVNSKKIQATVAGITYSPDGAHLVLTGPDYQPNQPLGQISVLDGTNLHELRTLITTNETCFFSRSRNQKLEMPVFIGGNAFGSKTAITNKRPFRVKRTYPKILRNRKNRIARRLAPKNWEDQPSPMLKASNIHYEMAERAQGMNCGGIGAMHLMVQRLGLVEDINQNLELLKVHLPYHESDHVLNITYNILAGGVRLEDIELRRQDEVFLNGLGAERIPDPDHGRRFHAAL